MSGYLVLICCIMLGLWILSTILGLAIILVSYIRESWKERRK